MLRTAIIASTVVVSVHCVAQAIEPIDIGSRRELLVDDYLIEEMSGGTELRLHQPTPQDVVFISDMPWEGNVLFHVTVLQDGDLYRMYYRGQHYDLESRQSSKHKVICYAESHDAIHWTRPDLGLVEFDGSKKNNILIDCKTSGIAGNGALAVFKDESPNAQAKTRYKAVATYSPHGRGLSSFGSPDGIHWSLLDDKASITKGAFDSHNLAFWDAERSEYRAYFRFFDKGVRAIRTCTSRDFINWSEPVDLKYSGVPREHLYTNAVRPYYRAPHICLGFPKRFVPKRKSPAGHPMPGVSDAVFMSSRDRVRFKRWAEAFVRPGPQRDRWINRNNFIAWGMVETPSAIAGAPQELSLYSTESYYTGEACRLRRYTIRIDGFVSASAPLSGGELVTKPFLFNGKQLTLNFSTSAAGGIRVEIQDPDGEPIPGFTLADCHEVFGDTHERTVSWQQGHDVNRLAGEPVRLRFVLRDADLYSLRFQD